MFSIEWDNKYSVNNRKFDNQHKKIIDILNQLARLSVPGKEGKVAKIIDDLVDYIKRHFSIEEAYLSKHRYPEFEQHKSEHDKFINKVCEFQKEYFINKSLPVINIYNFVWDWFANHILVTDKKYQSFFEAEP